MLHSRRAALVVFVYLFVLALAAGRLSAFQMTPAPAIGAPIQTVLVNVSPAIGAACANANIQNFNAVNGDLFACVAGAWAKIASTGGNANVASPASWGAALTADLQATAKTGVVRVVAIGDSLTECDVTTCGGSFPQDANMWIQQMRTYLQGRYGNHGTGYVPFRGNLAATGAISQWLSGAAGTINSCSANTFSQAALTGAAGANGPGQSCVQPAFGAVFTSKPMPFDHLNVYYQSFNCGTVPAPDCAGNGFTLNIDGSNLGTYGNQNTGCCYAQTTNVAAAANGLHTWTLTTNGTQASHVNYLYGYEGTVGNTGVSVDNLAEAGGRAEFFSQFGAGGTGAFLMPAQIWAGNTAHTWFVIMLGTNDYTFDSSLHSQYYYSGILSDLITTRGIPASHILLISPPMEKPSNSLNVATNDEFWMKKMVEQLARSYGAAYLDLASVNPVWASFQASNDAGYRTPDGIHLTDAGTLALWRTLLAATNLQ